MMKTKKKKAPSRSSRKQMAVVEVPVVQEQVLQVHVPLTEQAVQVVSPHI
jgi:hypothetical protein